MRCNGEFMDDLLRVEELFRLKQPEEVHLRCGLSGLASYN